MVPPLNHGGGAEKYFIDLAKNLSSNNLVINVVTMDDNFIRVFSRFIQIYYYQNFFRKIIGNRREREETVIRNLGNSKWIKSSWKNLRKVLNDYDIIYTKNELVDLFLL